MADSRVFDTSVVSERLSATAPTRKEDVWTTTSRNTTTTGTRTPADVSDTRRFARELMQAPSLPSSGAQLQEPRLPSLYYRRGHPFTRACHSTPMRVYLLPRNDGLFKIALSSNSVSRPHDIFSSDARVRGRSTRLEESKSLSDATRLEASRVCSRRERECTA